MRATPGGCIKASCLARRPLCHKVNLPASCEAQRLLCKQSIEQSKSTELYIRGRSATE